MCKFSCIRPAVVVVAAVAVVVVVAGMYAGMYVCVCV